MATNRRKIQPRKKRSVAVLGNDLARALLCGMPFFGPYDEATLGAAWKVHGEDIMEACLPLFPGCRPFGWWLFEGVPKHGLRKLMPDVDATSWPKKFGILHTHLQPPAQESELEYLARHGLLTAEEKRMHQRGELADPVPDQFGITPADYSVWVTDELLDELAGGDDD